MRGRLLNLPAIVRAAGFALVAIAIVAATLHFGQHEPRVARPACESARGLRSAH